MQNTLTTLIERQALRNPDREAYFTRRPGSAEWQPTTWHTFADNVGAAACALEILGLEPQQILTIFSAIQGYPSAEEFKSLAPSVAEAMKTGPWVLFVLYFFLTVAELFISPLGLSFVSKVAPKHLQGLCQGLWLGATAVGNLLLWVGPLIYNACPIWVAWTVFLSVCVVSMGVMFAMVNWLERVTR